MAQEITSAILVPMEVDEFWKQCRQIIREEFAVVSVEATISLKALKIASKMPGFQQKPIYSMEEIRFLFDEISRTTVYEWIKEGLLIPRKLKGKVYFLWSDIEKMLLAL
jgi:predicted DNA-binding transcriptional regulator AlpA